MDLAIIPAKHHSSEVPYKNFRALWREPLFLHSVRYAVKEGVPCVVSTDSEIIKGLCRRNNIPYLHEEVDDSNILNCVTQVVKKEKVDKWILLQPTSPIRPPSLLKKLLSKNNENIMTVQKIYLHGKLGSRFIHKTRRQESSEILYQFNGSILIGSYDMVMKEQTLFKNPLMVEQRGLYNYQIDYLEDFEHLERYGNLHCGK